MPIHRDALLLMGDARDVLRRFPPESIDMCITSPPYYALRDYGVDGQLGLEATFHEYVEELTQVFDEVRRVTKSRGTCWVNMGDTYGGSNCGYGQTPECAGFQNVVRQPYYATSNGKPLTARVMPKCLLMLPFRFAIEMVNHGWILRNTIIWHKPNCVPSSARDRFTVDFEYLFFFSKSTEYYFETQLEPWQDKRPSDINRAIYGSPEYHGKYASNPDNGSAMATSHCVGDPNRGRNKRCVWRISTKPFPGSHFAAYPPELIETPIKAGCPENGIVLDPFLGSGTTAEVALKMGRRCVGIDLNPDYIQIASRRVEPLLGVEREGVREHEVTGHEDENCRA